MSKANVNDDASSSDSEAVDIAGPTERPIPQPRARNRSVSKSLEIAAMADSPVVAVHTALSPKNHSSQIDDEDDEESTFSETSGGMHSESDVDEGQITVEVDFTEDSSATTDDNKATSTVLFDFPYEYRNITTEFADVEIFAISLDSLIVEAAAQPYLNWTLAGQTSVYNHVIDRLLTQFDDMGGHFKLLLFRALEPLFEKDTDLQWVHAAAIAYIRSSKWGQYVEVFDDVQDERYINFLHDLNPSFLVASTDEPVGRTVGLRPCFETLVYSCLRATVPWVPFTGLSFNFSSVWAYFAEPVPITNEVGYESAVGKLWPAPKVPTNSTPIDVTDCQSVADLWVQIIQTVDRKSASEHWESLVSAVLIGALVSVREESGARRVYLPEASAAKRGVHLVSDRRLLLRAAATFLARLNYKTLRWSLADLWDGRLIVGIYDALCANEKVLPYRVQDDFARLHCSLSLIKSPAVDTDERLFDPVTPSETPEHQEKAPPVYPINSAALKKFAGELLDQSHQANGTTAPELTVGTTHTANWPDDVELRDEIAKKKVEVKKDDKIEARKFNRQRQRLLAWYDMFANSLEGRGTRLQVDFARVPKYAQAEEADEKSKEKGWKGQNNKKDKEGKEKKGGGKPGAGGKSKKDLIMEANKKQKVSKLVDDEKQRIMFAVAQKNAIPSLERLELELDEANALKYYELAIRTARQLSERFVEVTKPEVKCRLCIPLVEYLKKCLNNYWEHLTPAQKLTVDDLWAAMGFDRTREKRPAGAPRPETWMTRLKLNCDIVYFQMEYGGELIDIRADPAKDDRVTGFHPDAWQRKMLDSVDKNQSVVIVAPTSAGKTFVSYYCIERVLRSSDEDVVVYVSPSKALINQVGGSVLARFRGKSLRAGVALFGTLTNEYEEHALNCQVLVTIPDQLDRLLLSPLPEVQEFVSRIKYVIFDEVHSIGSSSEASIWEHLLLLVRAPFIALSATIGNASELHAWLNAIVGTRSKNTKTVELIEYGERYAELELALHGVSFKDKPLDEGKRLMPFIPHSVYMREKLRMFGIPNDQQLTARQIVSLYRTLADVDETVRKECEPNKFFGTQPGTPRWLARSDLRKLEDRLKAIVMDWVHNDERKMNVALERLKSDEIKQQLDSRAKPFNKLSTALTNIVPLIDELRANNDLPAIVFSEDRHASEKMAEALFDELERREREFMESDEYKQKYEIKNEDKIEKLLAKKKEAEQKAKSKKLNVGSSDRDARRDDQDDRQLDAMDEDNDPLAAMRIKLQKALEKFKLRGRTVDNELYREVTDRMKMRSYGRPTTLQLLRLFERGIGVHHPAYSANERGSVEILYRAGYLAVVFSTSTLALGINMPCRTVIFGVDTPDLTPLLFRQMAGRAGRRGFDHSGNVVFLSVPTAKMRRLLTASLSRLRGNPPYTPSFLLRLFSFVHHADADSTQMKHPARSAMAYTLLGQSMAHFTRSEVERKFLPDQLRAYTVGSMQLFRQFGFIDDKCVPTRFAQLAVHLHRYEPGNLVFVHLLQQGIIHSILQRLDTEPTRCEALLLILANLFSRIRCPHTWDPKNKRSYVSDSPSKIFLEAPPDEVVEAMREWRDAAIRQWRHYQRRVAPHHSLLDRAVWAAGVDETRLARPVDGLLVSPLPSTYISDREMLAYIDPDEVDHRGRKVYYNAYILDFYRLASRRGLSDANRIHVNRVWYDLNAFATLLKELHWALARIGRPKDIVVMTAKVLSDDYTFKFKRSFGMRQKEGGD